VYVVRVHVESLHLGQWGMKPDPGVVRYLVEVDAPDGRLIESYRSSTSVIGYSSGKRVRAMGTLIARNVCRYLRARRLDGTTDQS
jgi:hypothetical protein